MRIVERRGTFYVERPARRWAQLLAAFLILLWALVMVAGLGGAMLMEFLVATLLLGAPGIWLALTLGTPKRERVITYVDGRQVPGGVLLRVVDARNVPHELVVDKVLGLGLALAFSAPPSPKEAA